jgi:multidrug efflux pump subunit AcrA (membrane-fusion protein)
VSQPPVSQSRRSIRRHSVAGLVIVLILGGGVGGWAGTMKLTGALIAPGSVVVDSNVKKVQHPTGGIVGEVRVRDGDRVRSGDVVVRLDDTVTRANLAIVTKGLAEVAPGERARRWHASRFSIRTHGAGWRSRCEVGDQQRAQTV